MGVLREKIYRSIDHPPIAGRQRKVHKSWTKLLYNKGSGRDEFRKDVVDDFPIDREKLPWWPPDRGKIKENGRFNSRFAGGCPVFISRIAGCPAFRVGFRALVSVPLTSSKGLTRSHSRSASQGNTSSFLYIKKRNTLLIYCELHNRRCISL